MREYRAVIGIGSNAIRMLVAVCGVGAGNTIHPIERFREDVRPFAGLLDGSFSPESVSLITATVKKLAAIASRQYGVMPALIATAAVRDAANATLLAAAIYEACRLDMRVLSGDEEARLSLIGAAASGDCNAVIDIGGGSTEVAYFKYGGGVVSGSMNLGAVRLSVERPELSGIIPFDDVCDSVNSINGITSITGIIRDISCVFRESMGTLPPGLRFAGVGGTITTLAGMKAGGRGRRDAVEGACLSCDDARRFMRTLCGLSVERRKEMPGLPRKRADIILAGCAILYAFMSSYGISGVSVTNRGNLDGYLIASQGDNHTF